MRTLFPEELPEGSPRFAETHDAQRYLKSIADYLRGEDLVVHTVVLPLEAAEGIVDEAAFSQVDLIVMATHGRKGINALLHPSVTWQVLRQTNAPILTCKCASNDDPAALTLHLPRFMTDPQAPILVRAGWLAPGRGRAAHRRGAGAHLWQPAPAGARGGAACISPEEPSGMKRSWARRGSGPWRRPRTT